MGLALGAALKNAKAVCVMDRADSYGGYGPLFMEIAPAVYPYRQGPVHQVQSRPEFPIPPCRLPALPGEQAVISDDYQSLRIAQPGVQIRFQPGLEGAAACVSLDFRLPSLRQGGKGAGAIGTGRNHLSTGPGAGGFMRIEAGISATSICRMKPLSPRLPAGNANFVAFK